MIKKLFQKLFNRRPDCLSIREHMRKRKIAKLIKDLHEAEEILSNYSGGYSEGFYKAEDFHKALIKEIEDIEFGNKTDFGLLLLWFSPTYDWDDFVGDEGTDIANKIFLRLYELMYGKLK